MNDKRSTILWITGFILLSLYVHLTPQYFDAANVPAWFMYWAGFFLLAVLVNKYLLRLRSIKSFGLQLHKGWWENLGLGFLVGFAVYAIKYLAFYELGKFEVAGLMGASFIWPMLGQALLAMFFSSILNDVTIRGYWYAFFKQKQLMAWYLVAVTVLYALGDIWNGEAGLLNLIFSAIIGLAFAYTVLKTGSIWMSLGLHWGGNAMFRVMYGFNGQGILKLEQVQEAPLFDYISLFISALMLPAVYFILKGKAKKVIQPKPQIKEEQVV